MPNVVQKIREIAEVASDALNERECEFIDDVLDGRRLSEAQVAWVDRLYEKVCQFEEGR